MNLVTDASESTVPASGRRVELSTLGTKEADTLLQRSCGVTVGDEPTLPDDAAGRLKLLEEKELEKEGSRTGAAKGQFRRSVGWAGPL
jgi:hypothetical protein